MELESGIILGTVVLFYVPSSIIPNLLWVNKQSTSQSLKCFHFDKVVQAAFLSQSLNHSDKNGVMDGHVRKDVVALLIRIDAREAITKAKDAKINMQQVETRGKNHKHDTLMNDQVVSQEKQSQSCQCWSIQSRESPRQQDLCRIFTPII